MKKLTKRVLKKICHIFMTIIFGIIGIRYPKIEETIKEVAKEIEELTNLK